MATLTEKLFGKKEEATKPKSDDSYNVISFKEERVDRAREKKFATTLCQLYRLVLYMDQRVFETKNDPVRYFVCRHDKAEEMVQYIIDNHVHGKARKALFHHSLEPCGSMKTGIMFYDSYINGKDAGNEFVDLGD